MLDRGFFLFVGKFLGFFALFYLGTLGVIGLAAPGGWYSPMIDHYFDYVSGIKNTLMWAAGGFLQLFGIGTHPEPGYLLRMNGGRGVIINMDCVGYGVYSFWLAWVLAHGWALKRFLLWGIGGLILLWGINVLRIAGYLWVINQYQQMPLGIDHHTWFTIAAYGVIGLMMWGSGRNDE
jgi:exosortase/archaeosortase family protein